MSDKKLKLVLCWHMHQPHYRDGVQGAFRLPWVYLHAMKDYSDMVAHLETCPQARVVVNFAPILLEQLSDYAQQMQQWLQAHTPMQDPLLNLLSGQTAVGDSVAQRLEIVQACQKAFAPTMIEPFAPYKKLLAMTHCDEQTHPDQAQCLRYFNTQFYHDLLVWYHLAWMGQSVRHQHAGVARLIEKGMAGQSFTLEDRVALVTAMAEVIDGLIPRYKACQDRGQIEISMTPYSHPIVPLMIDFQSMRDAQPHDPMPVAPIYPDGFERAKWHMERGFGVYQKYFDCRPRGVWLSEGAISSASIGLLDHYQIQWTASGEGVWRHACEASQIDAHEIASKKALYQPLQHATQHCNLFFRDDGLSDLIGFQYKDWGPQDAANNFVHHLQNIANSLGDAVSEHVVSVILDGENAWEYYPDNAWHFLQALYQTLSDHPQIEMTTFEDAQAQVARPKHLSVLKAGSWVFGSFSTWIGDKDKNAAWDLLVQAKKAYDQAITAGHLSEEQRRMASEQLAICEGSDWFWWFGDYNPSDSVRDFDRLYRRHLRHLYQLLQKPAPESLSFPLSHGGGHMDNAGTMRRN